MGCNAGKIYQIPWLNQQKRELSWRGRGRAVKATKSYARFLFFFTKHQPQARTNTATPLLRRNIVFWPTISYFVRIKWKKKQEKEKKQKKRAFFVLFCIWQFFFVFFLPRMANFSNTQKGRYLAPITSITCNSSNAHLGVQSKHGENLLIVETYCKKQSVKRHHQYRKMILLGLPRKDSKNVPRQKRKKTPRYCFWEHLSPHVLPPLPSTPFILPVSHPPTPRPPPYISQQCTEH